MLVALGILCSRLVGLVRQRVIAHYFGLTTDAADAWAAGFRIPNFLQNLFGEGALSASFIPVYSALLGEDRHRADRVAGAVGALLAAAVSAIVLVGVFATPSLIDLIAPGFSGGKRALTIQVVRILFPGAGLLVLSAWCLGILNSHHKFFLSYAAPVIWSVAMIAALLYYGAQSSLPELVRILAWASVAGSALQCLVQLPMVIRVAPDLALFAGDAAEQVRTVVRNFVPAFFSRGVVQVSAYIDTLLASLLPTGAVAALTNAQVLTSLPVSLFGISVSAAELPAMARAAAGESGQDALRERLDRGLRQIAFLVVPTAIAFLAFGDLIAGALLQSGRFSADDARYVWGILGGSSVGLLASTLGRLYASAFYARRDTRTPLAFAVVRVVLTTTLGYLCAIPLPAALGLDPAWGAAGLTASAGAAGWVEMFLLRRALNARIGPTGIDARLTMTLWLAAIAGAAVAWAVKFQLTIGSPIVLAAIVLPVYGLVYLGIAIATGVPEARTFVNRVRSRR